ncbi:hypothetical protein KY359_03275 [Candidatus Woesearchaeota archaeon]|nr:hypothetical protein [Candidatus Woesearchaeota archaeon]
MEIDKFRNTLADIKEKVLTASNFKGDLKKAITSGQYIYDYKLNRAKYVTDRIKKSASELVGMIDGMHKRNRNKRLEEHLTKVMVNTKFLAENHLEPGKALPIIEQIERDLKELDKVMQLEKEIHDFEKEAAAAPLPKGVKPEDIKLNFSIPDLPEEIAENIQADVDELQKCFSAGCYRSAIILCGRIIETALHRKYFEVTGNDALEKEPGIGLGKLVARMSEKSIRLDPALPQQIHFINQVRIFSVHTKQQAFTPSRVQAQATILYTMDVMGRLFT